MPFVYPGALAESRLCHAYQTLGRDDIHFAVTLLAPEARPSRPLDRQDDLGFNGDFSPFSTSHGFRQPL